MKGLLAEAGTKIVKAKRDLDRYRPLAKMNAVSQSYLDGAVAAYDAAKAGVEAAQANVEAALIQMGYTKIYSPIDVTMPINISFEIGTDPDMNTVFVQNPVPPLPFPFPCSGYFFYPMLFVFIGKLCRYEKKRELANRKA